MQQTLHHVRGLDLTWHAKVVAIRRPSTHHGSRATVAEQVGYARLLAQSQRWWRSCPLGLSLDSAPTAYATDSTSSLISSRVETSGLRQQAAREE